MTKKEKSTTGEATNKNTDSQERNQDIVYVIGMGSLRPHSRGFYNFSIAIVESLRIRVISTLFLETLYNPNKIDFLITTISDPWGRCSNSRTINIHSGLNEVSVYV